MHSLARLLSICVLVQTVAAAGWEPIDDLPAMNFASSQAGSLGDTLVFLYITQLYFYTDETGWVQQANDCPATHSDYSSASTGTSFYAIAGRAPTSSAEVHAVNLQGVWTTKADYPTASANLVGSTSDGVSMVWAGGGRVPPNNFVTSFHAFDAIANAWEAKENLPAIVNQYGNYMGYTDGTILLGHASAYKYTVAADTWTIAVGSPLSNANQYHALVGGDGLFYCFGYNTDLTVHYVYTLASDEWTVLDAIPNGSLGAGHAAYVSPGRIFLLGHTPNTVTSYVYNLPTPAELQGDPQITTFDGTSDHLDLRAGTFTFLASSALAVTVLVDHVATLPPEENTVVVGVGITQEHGAHAFASYCHTHASGFSCDTRSRSSTPPVTALHHSARFDLPDLSLWLDFEAPTVVAVSEQGTHTHTYPTSAFLNLRVRLRRYTAVHHMTGLLADAHNLGFDEVRRQLSLGMYERESVF